jgi:tetratricopeptide (TPR) repeat protein
VAIFEKALGPEHPDVATALSNLAGNLLQADRAEEALEVSRRALAIGEKVYGAEHPLITDTLGGIASVLVVLGRYDEAATTTRRAIDIVTKSQGPDDPKLGLLYGALAMTYRHAKKYRDSCAAIDESLRIAEKSLGTSHPYMASALTNRADCHLRNGQPAAAIADAERALAIARKAGMGAGFLQRAQDVLDRARKPRRPR